MNKILLFRFDSVSPNDIDQKVLKFATKHNGESMKVESTRYGFVAILNTRFSCSTPRFLPRCDFGLGGAMSSIVYL